MVDGENNFSQNLFTSMLKMNFDHFAVTVFCRYFHPESEVPHNCLLIKRYQGFIQDIFEQLLTCDSYPPLCGGPW